MSAILPKCYQPQGQPFLLSFRSSKNLENHKESHSMVQKNAQINDRSESYRGLMELGGIIYTMLSNFNSSHQDTICKTTFYRHYGKFGFKSSIVDTGYILSFVT